MKAGLNFEKIINKDNRQDKLASADNPYDNTVLTMLQITNYSSLFQSKC